MPSVSPDQSTEGASVQDPAGALIQRYRDVRAASERLAEPLAAEDTVVQSMPDVSPTKWHLAHTSWFFESFILRDRLPGYRVFHEGFHYLFNSYYYTKGAMHLRPQRGLLSRPTLQDVMAYRRHVDAGMEELAGAQGDDPEISFLVELGLNHEQQHQELTLTDIKHVFSVSPLLPAYLDLPASPTPDPGEMSFREGPSGIREIGAGEAAGFRFDNETPRHRTYVHGHALADRPVTNAEYLEFIRDGGYDDTALWLSDAWALIQQEGWDRPLYWSRDLTSEFTLGGERELDPHAPVTHVSYFEAEAFARWAGCRLPTETEWELAATASEVEGNFVGSGLLHPGGPVSGHPRRIFGDVWEWTASPYSPYPGFRPLRGSLGEYNGKFMCSQMVCRGGSCVSPGDHLRASYRNFFYPHQRWQFFGIRLAKDA